MRGPHNPGGLARPARAVAAVLLLAAVAGAAVECSRRFDEVSLWRHGPADAKEYLHYGPYREVFAYADAHIPPTASLLLFSEWDPALLPYYLYPRRIWQVDVEPEYNHVLMRLPPSSYPRRDPGSFAVDWVLWLRDVDGTLVPEFQERRQP
ncbi:MAG TPA: hypothetical protein VI078_01755 [bacterium]